MKSKSLLSLFIGILIAIICLVSIVILYFLITPSNRQFALITPQVTILSAPFVPTIVPPTATIPPEVAATLAVLPPDPGNAIQVGMTVHISGTGGDGLRVRKEPGVNADPLFLGAENEEFVVKDGPKSVDNLTWWFISAPFDEKRQGWAAANYLTPIPNP